MGPLPLLVLFSILGNNLQSNAFPSLSSIRSINEFNNAIAATLYEAHKLSLTQPDSINKLGLLLNDTNLVAQHVIGNHLIALSESMQESLDPLIEAHKDSWNFNDVTTKLVNSFEQFDQFFNTFTALVAYDTIEDSSYNQVNEEAFGNFVSEIINDNKLENIITSIYEAVTPRESNNTFTFLRDYLKEFDKNFKNYERCDFTIPVQDNIKNVYDLVVLNEIRGFAMILFALNYQQITDGVTNENAISEKISSFMERVHTTLGVAKTLTSNARIDLLACDPNQHVLDETCFRLEDLFTKYFANEQQLSDTTDVNFKSFSTYNRVECLDETSNSNALHLKYYCPERQCFGKIHDCRTVSQMPAFCESPYKSGPRYLWAVDKYNSTNIENCPGEFIDTMTKSSYRSLMCQCSEEGAESEATRAINMNPQMADFKNNMVVTNVRFLKQDNMIHLQIEQGALLPEAKIDPDTVEIVPVGRFRYLKDTDTGSFVMINPSDYDDEIYLKYDTNYTFITHDHNVLHLDEINVDRGYVITGVRLRNSDFNPENGINTSPIELQVHATKFDYHKGILRPDLSKGTVWITPKNLDNRPGYTSERELLDLSNMEDSMTEEFINVVDSLPNQEIEFQPSAVSGNLGQTTIPYFDARAPAVNNLRALKGVGIIHRGVDGFGGFLAPKLMTINHTEYALAGVKTADKKKWMKEWLK
ncbi:uncharacterized protein LOC123268203 [Cotesia glomerata]|uniref:Uncharacterized protein n=1 Tax=Cotesia glomerata TaxID=32391 RepID=A0AAV7HVJ3_COTGL|nr:uncharacterized protein LOC123268203 [Cotesia glomerata]KAH0534352.1 hypothetical protein KQX54_003269 [Cotesia glomerata]